MAGWTVVKKVVVMVDALVVALVDLMVQTWVCLLTV